MAIEFINADLEIVSTEPLEGLRDELLKDSRFMEMSCIRMPTGEYFAGFELHLEEMEQNTAAVLALEFCKSLQGLSPENRRVWDSANRRVIDPGYQSDDRCPAFSDSLPPAVLAAMSDLSIELAITIYPIQIEAA